MAAGRVEEIPRSYKSKPPEIKAAVSEWVLSADGGDRGLGIPLEKML